MNLWFCNEEVRQLCTDADLMRRRWGRGPARCLARRLQQLYAMAALSDIDFLPFDVGVLDDGALEVEIGGGVVLVLVADSDRPNDQGDVVDHLTVTEVAVVAARTSQG